VNPDVVDQPDGEAGRVAGGAGQEGVEQRLAIPARGSGLPPGEAGQQRHGQAEQRPQAGQATVAGIHHRQQQTEHPAAQQQRPDQVELEAAPARPGLGRQQPGRQGQGDQADG
jgi:hypothetical protein